MESKKEKRIITDNSEVIVNIDKQIKEMDIELDQLLDKPFKSISDLDRMDEISETISRLNSFKENLTRT